MLDRIRRDVSYTARSLRRSPTFTLTVALILGLAIGMSSAMFTVFRSVLITRLPVRDQDRIVELSGIAAGAASEVPLTPAQIQRLRDQSHTLTSVAALAHWRVIDEALTDGDRRVTLKEAVVTDEFFDVLGANPVVGRFFQKGDALQWGANSAGTGVPIVLSYSAWKRDLGGDSSVVGRHLLSPKMNWTMNVIGVAPAGLDYPRGVEFWVGAVYGSSDVVARIAPNVSVEAARQDFQNFIAHDPDFVKYGMAATKGQIHTLSEMIVGDARPALLALTAAVALLLVLACTNVGNLLLLRSAGRVREMAIRRAIGASAADIVRQLLTESALLAVAGGVLGVAFSKLLLSGLVRMAPSSLPRADLIAGAGAPIAIGALVTAATVILFGVIPSFAALRFDLSSPLRSDTRSGTEGRKLRNVRQLLVASQIALAVVVLAGAGLLVRSLARLTSLDMGYTTEHLSMLNFSLPWRQYAGDCRPKRDQLVSADSAVWNQCAQTMNFVAHERVMANLRQVPGVMSVSPEAVPPFLGSNVWMGRYASQEQSDADSRANPWFGFDAVGPEYFQTLGVKLIAGRAFTDADREDSPRVAIITEAIARRLWPNESAVGKRLRQGEDHTPDSLITVVGVVRDFHYRLHRESTPTIFRPYRQVLAQGYLVVRERGAEIPTSVLQRAVEDAGGGAIFIRSQSMDALIEPQLSTPRFDALLLSIFAVAALVLAAVGLYGIMASAVNQQTRELGIRMALGATAGGVRNMVMRQALTVAIAGTIVGLVGAIGGSRLLTSMLFEVAPSDPATLGLVSVLLLVIATGAAYIPARRATRIDPARALRAE
jgi:putative ABC transport system permease protein